MPPIHVEREAAQERKWTFLVRVGIEDAAREYEVTLDVDYYVQLTNKTVEPEELVRRSFRFLLEREPKEAILQQFNLRDINRYFPEYESEIGQ